jgi:hypothetical protein
MLLEGREVAVGRPHFELRIARAVQLEEEVVAAIAEVEAGNHLCVAAFEALRETQDRRE